MSVKTKCTIHKATRTGRTSAWPAVWPPLFRIRARTTIEKKNKNVALVFAYDNIMQNYYSCVMIKSALTANFHSTYGSYKRIGQISSLHIKPPRPGRPPPAISKQYYRRHVFWPGDKKEKCNPIPEGLYNIVRGLFSPSPACAISLTLSPVRSLSFYYTILSATGAHSSL